MIWTKRRNNCDQAIVVIDIGNDSFKAAWSYFLFRRNQWKDTIQEHNRYVLSYTFTKQGKKKIQTEKNKVFVLNDDDLTLSFCFDENTTNKNLLHWFKVDYYASSSTKETMNEMMEQEEGNRFVVLKKNEKGQSIVINETLLLYMIYAKGVEIVISRMVEYLKVIHAVPLHVRLIFTVPFNTTNHIYNQDDALTLYLNNYILKRKSTLKTYGYTDFCIEARSVYDLCGPLYHILSKDSFGSSCRKRSEMNICLEDYGSGHKQRLFGEIKTCDGEPKQLLFYSSVLKRVNLNGNIVLDYLKHIKGPSVAHFFSSKVKHRFHNYQVLDYLKRMILSDKTFLLKGNFDWFDAEQRKLRLDLNCFSDVVLREYKRYLVQDVTEDAKFKRYMIKNLNEDGSNMLMMLSGGGLHSQDGVNTLMDTFQQTFDKPLKRQNIHHTKDYTVISRVLCDIARKDNDWLTYNYLDHLCVSIPFQCPETGMETMGFAWIPFRVGKAYQFSMIPRQHRGYESIQILTHFYSSIKRSNTIYKERKHVYKIEGNDKGMILDIQQKWNKATKNKFKCLYSKSCNKYTDLMMIPLYNIEIQRQKEDQGKPLMIMIKFLNTFNIKIILGDHPNNVVRMLLKVPLFTNEILKEAKKYNYFKVKNDRSLLVQRQCWARFHIVKDYSTGKFQKRIPLFDDDQQGKSMMKPLRKKHNTTLLLKMRDLSKNDIFEKDFRMLKRKQKHIMRDDGEMDCEDEQEKLDYSCIKHSQLREYLQCQDDPFTYQKKWYEEYKEERKTMTKRERDDYDKYQRNIGSLKLSDIDEPIEFQQDLISRLNIVNRD